MNEWEALNLQPYSVSGTRLVRSSFLPGLAKCEWVIAPSLPSATAAQSDAEFQSVRLAA